MERRYITEIKQQYRDLILEQGENSRALEITNNPLYSPIFKTREIHPEAEPEPKDINDMITEVFFDLNIIDSEIMQAAKDLNSLMLSTTQRLKNVETILLNEKERQQDINILCNKYTDFGTVINLDESFFSGDFSMFEGVMSAKIIDEVNVQYDIESIYGNGYEGNDYVYKDNNFTKDIIDTSNREYINDRSIITAYEYSRITASNSEKNIFPLVNFDSIEAKCAIVFHSNTAFNSLRIESDLSDLIINEVHISNDGATFEEVSKKTISLTNKEKRYEVQDYVPGSGIISFPTTNYVKILLQSKGYLDDTIAFYKTETINID